MESTLIRAFWTLNRDFAASLARGLREPASYAG